MPPGPQKWAQAGPPDHDRCAPTLRRRLKRQIPRIVRGAHKKNECWLKKHPNVHFHFTPTRASWLNQIETWFSILQGQSLSGASFTAVEQLQKHIDAFIAAYNETAQPFAWTKKKVRQRRFKNRRITQL
jgi:transposase